VAVISGSGPAVDECTGWVDEKENSLAVACFCLCVDTIGLRRESDAMLWLVSPLPTVVVGDLQHHAASSQEPAGPLEPQANHELGPAPGLTCLLGEVNVPIVIDKVGALRVLGTAARHTDGRCSCQEALTHSQQCGHGCGHPVWPQSPVGGEKRACQPHAKKELVYIRKWQDQVTSLEGGCVLHQKTETPDVYFKEVGRPHDEPMVCRS
jgi:hypothetical protein